MTVGSTIFIGVIHPETITAGLKKVAVFGLAVKWEICGAFITSQQ